MEPTWGIKASPRRRGPACKRNLRWDLLGLRGPAKAPSSPSIEEVRRQIISASSSGLSPETLARSREQDEQPKPRPKASGLRRKRP